jgi:hypothetical protein
MTEPAPPRKSVSLVMNALNWAYSQASSSLPGIDNAEELARHHLARRGGDREKAIDDLITWQTRFAGAAGFVSNLGGIITLPVSVPANLASVLLIQLRMIGAIAHIRGYKINDEAVRTMAFLCLTGNGGASILRGASVGLGTRVSAHVMSRVSGAALARINQTVAARLAAAAGATGILSVARIVPFVGGLIGGGFDAAATRAIAAAAKRYFTPVEDEVSEKFIASEDEPVAAIAGPRAERLNSRPEPKQLSNK